jgi:hypothetical protein
MLLENWVEETLNFKPLQPQRTFEKQLSKEV